MQRKAAWQLYVELATRIASQPFDRSTGSIRAALESLYAVYTVTRSILKESGPDVAPDDRSFGPIAIRFLTEILAPFLLKWHEPLREYEAQRASSESVIAYEREWQSYDAVCSELAGLQEKVKGYCDDLADIAGICRTQSLPDTSPIQGF